MSAAEAEVLALAAAEKARGQAWEAEGTPESLQAAVRSYAAAAQLLTTRGLTSEAARFASGVLHMNRGNALQRAGAFGAAVAAYGEAIALLPDREDPEIQNARGAAWLNRGRALQALGGPDHRREALEAQDEALRLLRPLAAAADRDATLNLAGACLNRASLLVSAHRLGEAADAAEEGLALLRRPGLDRADSRPLAARLFQFGAEVYGHHQPQFLAEFIREQRDPADAEQTSAARAAVSGARERLGHTRLLLADDPASLRLLASWRELGALERELAAPAPEGPELFA